MAFKIYTEGNYFVIEDATGYKHRGLSKEVRVIAQGSTYRFENVEAWGSLRLINISQIQNQAGDAYDQTGFETFYTGNTGIDNSENKFSGWADYLDTNYTSGAPWQPTVDTWNSLVHNSGQTIKTQMPLDLTDLFADSKILGRNGDGLMVSIEFVGRPTTSSTTFLRVAVFIGNNLGPLGDGRIYQRLMSFPKGQNQLEPQTYTTGMFTLDTFEANGGTIQFNPTAAIDIFAIRVVPHRTHKAR